MYEAVRRGLRRFRRSSSSAPHREPFSELSGGEADLPRLREAEAPTVSIVVPVRDRSATTIRCLHSIAAADDGAVPFEVIAVDDASSPSTAERLRSVENLRVVTNEANLGFVRSCNKGAEAARGEYLLFLNNDTLVSAGWLETMLAAMQADPGAGLVGAKLVYPNGSLQEAGAIVWNDGTACNYGNQQDPDRPEFNFVREVDYCSAACLMVRRSLFEEAGGFDTRYTPAYYEDADLAFTARKMGFTTLYQPKAVVTHLEGASHGNDPDRGVKRHQSINQKVFATKWAAELAGQHAPSTRNLVRAGNRSRHPKVLVIENDVPYYDRDAGGLRLDHIIKLLQELGFGVTVLAHNRFAPEPYRERLQQRGVEVLYGSLDLSSFLRQVAPELKLTIACRPSVAWRYVGLIRRLAPGCRYVYDTVDLHFVREGRRAAVEHSQPAAKAADAYRRLELAIVESSDATITVSEQEAEVLRHEAPGSQVYVVPTIHSMAHRPNSFDHRQGLLFVGSFAHPPNGAALRYFVTDILPLVRRRLPETVLHVVGKAAPAYVDELSSEGVQFHGWVPEIEDFLQGCRVMVAPMTFGAGINGKITQGLSAGIPVVTTTLGAEAIGMVDGRDGLIADDPELFASKVVDLYCDAHLWAKLSAGGLDLAEQSFSVDAARRRLAEMTAALVPER